MQEMRGEKKVFNVTKFIVCIDIIIVYMKTFFLHNFLLLFFLFSAMETAFNKEDESKSPSPSNFSFIFS